jgi:hypothetical protein
LTRVSRKFWWMKIERFDALRLAPVTLACFCCLIASASCRSVTRSPGAPSEPLPDVPIADRELTLIRADSEVFDAVVRAQLTASDDDDYPRHLDGMQFDALPYGSPSGYPENFAGVQGIDPTLTFGRAGKSEIEDLIANRKRILERNGLTDARAPSYRQCAGAAVPKPPPARGSRPTRAKTVDVHAGCPRSREYYVTVGLPVRGQPEGLKNTRDVRGHRVSLKGDVWTALVDEHSAGPNGWTWSQYAWLFKRNDSGRLELANTILIGVIE